MPGMHMSGLYERCAGAIGARRRSARASAPKSRYCELLRSGVTSRCRYHRPVARGLGRAVRQERHARVPRARLRLGPLEHGRRPRARHYAWDEARGASGFKAAMGLIDAALAHPCGRLSGVVSPMQIDTCTADLLRDSLAAAPRAGPAFTRARGAGGHRGARDDPPTRPDAGRNGRTRSVSSGPARSSATRSLSTRIPGSAGTPRAISAMLGDSGIRGGALPDPVCALWPHHGEFRRLSPGRRQ